MCTSTIYLIRVHRLYYILSVFVHAFAQFIEVSLLCAVYYVSLSPTHTHMIHTLGVGWASDHGTGDHCLSAVPECLH